MLTIPGDLLNASNLKSTKLPQASIIDYYAREKILSEQVLVTRPTLVIVRSGVKQLASQQSDAVYTASSTNLIAFRSGTHLMSEFRAEDDAYSSYVISIDRGFLCEAIGLPQDHNSKGTKVAVSTPTPEAMDRLHEMPTTIASLKSATDREFRLREFIVTAMSDRAIRDLLYREVADWGSTLEERIPTIVSQHCLSPLRIEDLATLCGMSLASFKRHFTTIYQIPPGKWLKNTRLKHAHSLALNSRMNMSEICEACGYQDLSSFTRAFRHHYGQTPTAIRKSG